MQQTEQIEEIKQKYEEPQIKPKPHELFINLINIQKNKEEKQDIWKDSPYKDIVKLQSNNTGNVGENFIQNI